MIQNNSTHTFEVKQDIVIVGSKPPPIGGNTIHVQRLVASLTEKGCRARFVDYRLVEIGKGISYSPFRIVSKVNQYRSIESEIGPRSIVHIHVSALKRFRWFAPIILSIFKRHHVLVTIHSGSFVSGNEGKEAQVYNLFKRFSHIVAVSQMQADFLIGLGIDESKVSVIPAYLPAVRGGVKIPEAVAELDSSETVVLTSGQLLPIYNYEVLLDAIALRSTGEHFVFAFYGARDEEYAAEIYDKIQQLQTNHSVVVVEDSSPEVFLAILERSRVYIRTTRTDGDAVAIREALALGKPVIATNAVDRAEACILFDTESPEDLARSLAAKNTVPSPGIDECSNLDALLSVYNNLATNPHQAVHKEVTA